MYYMITETENLEANKIKIININFFASIRKYFMLCRIKKNIYVCKK